MSAKDVYHDIVKAALQKEGWLITHDPLVLELSSGRLEVDLDRNFFSGELAQLSVSEYQVKVLVFDPGQEVIVQWHN